MARGVRLDDLVDQLRAEIGHSVNPAVGVNKTDYLKQVLRRTQDRLWEEYDWSFLKVDRDIPLSAGQRYYDVPIDLPYERFIKVSIKYGGFWYDLDHGIDVEQYSLYDSDSDVRRWPVARWDVAEDTGVIDAYGVIEVWPIPSRTYEGNDGLMRITGFRSIGPLVEGDDRAELDNNLLVLMAAAEIQARQNQADAQIKLLQAQQLLTRLMNQSSNKKKYTTFIDDCGGDSCRKPCEITSVTSLGSGGGGGEVGMYIPLSGTVSGSPVTGYVAFGAGDLYRLGEAGGNLNIITNGGNTIQVLDDGSVVAGRTDLPGGATDAYLATKGYVDSVAGGIPLTGTAPGSPVTGNIEINEGYGVNFKGMYFNQSNAGTFSSVLSWYNDVDLGAPAAPRGYAFSVNDGTDARTITLNNDGLVYAGQTTLPPGSPDRALATKGYVDAVSGGGTGYVPIAGGTFTGPVQFDDDLTVGSLFSVAETTGRVTCFGIVQDGAGIGQIKTSDIRQNDPNAEIGSHADPFANIYGDTLYIKGAQSTNSDAAVKYSTLSQYAALSGAAFTGDVDVGGLITFTEATGVVNCFGLVQDGGGIGQIQTSDIRRATANADIGSSSEPFDGIYGDTLYIKGSQSTNSDAAVKYSTLNQYAALSGAAFTGTITVGGLVSMSTSTVTAFRLVQNGGQLQTSDPRMTSAQGSAGDQLARKDYVDTGDASDARLKENVTDAQEGLSEVLELQPVKYDYIEGAPGAKRPEHKQRFGLIAQEVKKVLPNVVTELPEGVVSQDQKSTYGEDLLAIDYSDLVPVLINAVKELSETVNELEQRLSDLGG